MQRTALPGKLYCETPHSLRRLIRNAAEEIGGVTVFTSIFRLSSARITWLPAPAGRADAVEAIRRVMGTIHLIEPTANGLRAAKGYLSEINAAYLVFGSVDACLEEAVPDLIILLADRDPDSYARDIDRLKKSRSHGGVKRLCILPFEVSMRRAKKQIADGESEHPLPLAKEKFLFSVAQCLNLPQRRAFSAIVTIQPEAGNLRILGKSVDFSETGMSFECDTDFPQKEIVRVSFGNPARGLRLQLRAMVVRKHTAESGTSFFHGVRFLDTPEEEKEQLRKFLSGVGNMHQVNASRRKSPG